MANLERKPFPDDEEQTAYETDRKVKKAGRVTHPGRKAGRPTSLVDHSIPQEALSDLAPDNSGEIFSETLSLVRRAEKIQSAEKRARKAQRRAPSGKKRV